MGKGNIVSFLNMKGGVGKTTLCKEIGYFLYKERKKKVLFIDVDPQANLTQSIFKRFGYKQKQESTKDVNLTPSSASVSAVFNYRSIIEEVEIEDALLIIDEKLSIIPGDLNTLFLERSMGGAEKENSLKNFIEDFELQDKYDYILLDCPPTYSFYTTAALLASDFYISPIKPDSYSILGLDLLQQVVDRLKKLHRDSFRHRPIYHLGVIFSNIDNSPSPGTQALIYDIKNSKTLRKYEMHFFNDYFLKNTGITKKIDYFINDHRSEKSIYNLLNIVKEFDERMELLWKEKSLSEQS